MRWPSCELSAWLPTSLAGVRLVVSMLACVATNSCGQDVSFGSIDPSDANPTPYKSLVVPTIDCIDPTNRWRDDYPDASKDCIQPLVSSFARPMPYFVANASALLAYLLGFSRLV